ncbi:uncharacterized protein LOC116653491 [Coturnix japonica]|uniref:uncharacterized protein LOC116653491 n=1 Tax=Coturnix japonica TaxID=93934 RepID=UPI0013A5C26E|nr:uncharacterized protein LOC116653491 [Coturnix japonica]
MSALQEDSKAAVLNWGLCAAEATMRLTVVFLLVALASYSCSPSAACDTLRKFVLSVLHDPLDQYLEFIEPIVGSSPLVKTAATQLKACAEDHSEELKEAQVEMMDNLLKRCEEQE